MSSRKTLMKCNRRVTMNGKLMEDHSINKPEFTFIRGENIYLRKLQSSDVDANYCRWMNDSESTRFLSSGIFPNSIESLKKYVTEKSSDKNTVFSAIVLYQHNRHIGNIKLGPIDWIHKRGDIGIYIGEKKERGKGLATEAISLMAKYAFYNLNLHKLTAGCTELNVGSLKSFQKNGFEIEGIRKKHFYYKGKYINTMVLGLINPYR